MTHVIFVLLVTCEVIFCYPQSILIPEITNKAPPEEVNSLAEHKHFTRSIATPSITVNNVEETIEEVEAMLKANPTLPRLTRGEILDLLENITKADLVKNTPLINQNEKLKDRDPKAVMMVMPYTPTNENENNLEDLFTKAPVTHIVGAEPFKKIPEVFDFKVQPTPEKNLYNSDDAKQTTPERNKLLRGDFQYNKIKSTTTSPTTITTTKILKESNNIENQTHKRRRIPQSTAEPPISSAATSSPSRGRRPIRRRPTTTEKHPNHRYPDEATTEFIKKATLLPSTGIRIVDPPKLSPIDINEDLQTQEDQRDDVFVKTDLPQPIYNISEKQAQVTVGGGAKQSSTAFPLVDMVPEHLKGVLADMNPASALKGNSSNPTLAKEPLEAIEEQRMKNMLASLGVYPVRTTTTTTSVPDISNVADNLTPEMRDLLMNFGLIPNEQKLAPVEQEPESFNPVKAEVKPESYVGFKPLPTDQSSRHEMEELLARFGLGKSSRMEKSMPKKVEKGLNFDVVPEEYKDVLEDIGLTDRDGRMIKSEPLVKTQEKQHVFNPVDTQYASNEEIEKLNKLLEIVRQLEKLNRTVTEEDLKQIDVASLKELISSLNVEDKVIPLDEQIAPNPINFDYGLEKNEVKRQKNDTTSTTTPAPTTAAPTTTTEEPKNANIKDLEASFGGQVDANPVTESAAPETTTPNRKTGVYYLVDWNTFLDVDNQNGKRVNLRFQPTIGDPKRFYSISVP